MSALGRSQSSCRIASPYNARPHTHLNPPHLNPRTRFSAAGGSPADRTSDRFDVNSPATYPCRASRRGARHPRARDSERWPRRSRPGWRSSSAGVGHVRGWERAVQRESVADPAGLPPRREPFHDEPGNLVGLGARAASPLGGSGLNAASEHLAGRRGPGCQPAPSRAPSRCASRPIRFQPQIPMRSPRP